MRDTNIEGIRGEELQGPCELEIIEVSATEAGKEGRILATPTRLRKFPLPLRKLVGDISDREKVILGLEIAPKKSRQGRE